MVDLRRPRNAPVASEPQDLQPDVTLTAPSPDLMARLHEHFAIYLPKSGHAGVVADEIAEQRGAWMVINFLQSIIDAQENRP